VVLTVLMLLRCLVRCTTRSKPLGELICTWTNSESIAVGTATALRGWPYHNKKHGW